MPPSPEHWEEAHERFMALLVLSEANERWGPLERAIQDLAASTSLLRADGARRKHWRARRDEAVDRETRELARHNEEVYEPLTAAAMHLLRMPAPDLAALRTKHGIAASGEIDLAALESEPGEIFSILQADVERLTGRA